MFEIRYDTVSSEQSRAEPNRGSIICPGGNAVVASRNLEAYMLILRKALLISAISGPLQLRARGANLGSARIRPALGSRGDTISEEVASIAPERLFVGGAAHCA